MKINTKNVLLFKIYFIYLFQPKQLINQKSNNMSKTAEQLHFTKLPPHIMLDFHIENKIKDIKRCRFGIKNGNWEGYSDALNLRRDALKRYKVELNELLNQI